MEKQVLVKSIVDIEWGMMDRVQNIDGRAACQDDRHSFYALREGQFLAWNMLSLTSYKNDLSTALSGGENLVEQKYAYMMLETDYENFKKNESLLPAVSEEKIEIIEELVRVHIGWAEELYRLLQYSSRRLRSSENTIEETSFETYLRGEMKTYSIDTLRLYQSHINMLQEKGLNISLMIAKNVQEKS